MTDISLGMFRLLVLILAVGSSHAIYSFFNHITGRKKWQQHHEVVVLTTMIFLISLLIVLVFILGSI